MIRVNDTFINPQYITSYSISDLSVTVNYDQGATGRTTTATFDTYLDRDNFLVNIQNAVDRATSQFPAGTLMSKMELLAGLRQSLRTAEAESEGGRYYVELRERLESYCDIMQAMPVGFVRVVPA